MSDISQCKHFVIRKKRFCKMTVKSGQEYCGEHMVPCDDTKTNASDGQLRVVCPLDPKHTCYANKLQKHLKICNARQTVSHPYIIKGVNCGDVIPVENDKLMTRLLTNVPTGQIKDVIKKVNAIYTDVIDTKITEKKLQHSVIEEEVLKPEYGNKTKKHLVQTSSILGLLEHYNLLQPETCYIEFGAGKGKLSYWVSKATNDLHNSSVLLIERAAHRHKYDNKLDKTDGRVHRIRADISDLVLDKVEIVHNAKSIVGLTKHLCGDATDLTIRCLTKYEQSGGKISGAVMAFCCHHRCQWTAYTGKNFFKDVGLSSIDFDIMCGMVSWATCGIGVGREFRNNAKDEDLQNFKLNDRDQEIGLNREQKADIGRKCKYILNWGRMTCLESLNFKCNLHYYVDEDVSPENLCIVAVKNKES